MFVGKLTTFTAAFGGGVAWLAVLAVVNTVASLFYYLRWPAFREPSDSGPAGAAETSSRSVTVVDDRRGAPWATSAAVVAAILSLVLGVAAGIVLPLLNAPT